MSNYKTYSKEKLVYFILSIAAYFLPFTVTAACLLPFVKAANGLKTAIGLGLVIINALPFITGVFKSFFAHFPMLNLLAAVFLALAAFFKLDVFKSYADIFLWIELAAALGSIASCALWAQYLKYADYSKTMKAALGSGAFTVKEDGND